nr:hypothetical protein [Nocardia cerradoensis]
MLELLDTEARAWLADLDRSTPRSAEGPFRGRSGRLVAAVTTTVQARPVLCDLISAQAAVLERNVSTEVVLRHKRSMHDMVNQIAQIVTTVLPELTADDGFQFASTTILAVAAAWPHSTPTEALQAAYDADPTVAELHVTFSDIVTRTLTLTLAGLLSERQAATAAEH